MPKEAKQKCFIDKWNTEDGRDLYQLCVQQRGLHNPHQREIPHACMEGNGFFTDSDELDTFLADNEDTIKIVEDYR